MLTHKLQYWGSYSGAGGPNLGLWCFVSSPPHIYWFKGFFWGSQKHWTDPKHSKSELTQNCSSHLPHTHFRWSGSFYDLMMDKMDKCKANKCKANKGKEHQLCPGWLDTGGPAGAKVTAPWWCCVTAPGWRGGGSEQLELMHSTACVCSHQRWSLGRAVTLQGLFESSLSQGSPDGSLGQPGTLRGGCWPRLSRGWELIAPFCWHLHCYKPCTPGNRRDRERQHSCVLLILFSFESGNSFQFTYSQLSPTQKFCGSCMNNPKTMQIKLAGQKQLEIGPLASAVISLEEGDGRQEHHLPSELSCRITCPQVLHVQISLQVKSLQISP